MWPFDHNGTLGVAFWVDDTLFSLGRRGFHRTVDVDEGPAIGSVVMSYGLWEEYAAVVPQARPVVEGHRLIDNLGQLGLNGLTSHSAPAALIALLRGENFGQAVVRIEPGPPPEGWVA